MTPTTTAYTTSGNQARGRRRHRRSEEDPTVLNPEPRRIRDLPEWADHEIGTAARMLMDGHGPDSIALELGVGKEKAMALVVAFRNIGREVKAPLKRRGAKGYDETVAALRARVDAGDSVSAAARAVGVSIGSARWLLSRDG